MARKTVDWTAIRKLFEQTDMSVASIANTHKVSRPAIDKRAAKEKWTINSAREELKAKRAGGSNVGEREQEPVSGIPREEISPTAWRRARELYEGTRMPMRAIVAQTGIGEVDLDFKIGDQGWSRFGSSRAQPSQSAEWRDGAMREAPTPSGEPAPIVTPPPTAGEIRRSIRAITHRDADRDLRAAKRLKPEQLVTIARDVLDRLICQIDDIIGNRDIIITLLEEAGEEGAISATRYAILEHAFDIVKLSGAARQVASAAKLLVEQSEARSGKKERQKEEAVSLSETGRFRKRGAGPRLVATGGEPV